MSLRDWLIVVGVLIVVGILVDGFRRARKNRRDSIALDQSLTEHLSDEDADLSFSARNRAAESNPELPNGGARVIRHEPVFDDVPQEQSNAAPELTDYPTAETMTESEAFSIDQRVPDTLHSEPPLEPSTPQPRTPQVAVEDVPVFAPEPEDRRAPAPSEQSATRPSFGFKRTEEKPVEASPSPRKSPNKTPVAPNKPKEAVREVECLADRAPAEEVLVINLITDSQQPFSGAQLLQTLLACDMKFGEMKIFHRFEQPGARGKIMFSMANGVEPGHFELDQMDELQTPAVSFFMGLPGASEPMQAFDKMVETVQYLQQELGGQLQDEGHSVLRQQTLSHYRQRVAEFERRQLMQGRS